MTTSIYNETICEEHDFEGREDCPDCLLKTKRTAFQTWRFEGVRYLAIPLDNRVHIISQDGSNFGSWFDVSSFRKRQESKKPQDWQALGMAMLNAPIPI